MIAIFNFLVLYKYGKFIKGLQAFLKEDFYVSTQSIKVSCNLASKE